MAIFQKSTSPSFPFSCLPERPFQCSRVVAHDAEVEHFEPEAREHAVERVAVGVVHLAFLERRADRGELIARGEEGDAQLSLDLDFAHAKGGDQPDVGGTKKSTWLQYRLAFGQILTC